MRKGTPFFNTATFFAKNICVPPLLGVARTLRQTGFFLSRQRRFYLFIPFIGSLRPFVPSRFRAFP